MSKVYINVAKLLSAIKIVHPARANTETGVIIRFWFFIHRYEVKPVTMHNAIADNENVRIFEL